MHVLAKSSLAFACTSSYLNCLDRVAHFSGTFYDMTALTKTCPECHAFVHIRKSVCKCGHCFVLKFQLIDTGRKSARIAMRSTHILLQLLHTTYTHTHHSITMYANKLDVREVFDSWISLKLLRYEVMASSSLQAQLQRPSWQATPLNYPG